VTGGEEIEALEHIPGAPAVEGNATVVRCTVCGEEISRTELPNLFAGTNMTLGGRLEMNFYVNTSTLPVSGCYAVVTRHYANGDPDDVVTYPQSEWNRRTDTQYYFTYTNLAAKEMTDVMEAVIYDANGNQISVVRSESIRSYAMRGVEKYESDPTKATSMTMFVDMLNYGAAAQMNFHYNETDLANALLTESQRACATSDSTAEITNTKGPGCAGTALGLENEIELTFIFNKTTVKEGMYATVVYTDHLGEVKRQTIQYSEFGSYGSTRVSVVVKGMALADGDQDVVCVIFDAEGKEVSYAKDNVNCYAQRGINSSTTTNEAKNLYNMILRFTRSAYAYFHP